MKDDDWLAGLLARMGQAIACDLCGALTRPENLTEVTVPGYAIQQWDVLVHRLAWVCPACPVP